MQTFIILYWYQNISLNAHVYWFPWKQYNRNIYHIVRISRTSGTIIKFNSVQFCLEDFHKLFGNKLTTWSQGPCLDSYICVWFYGLQSLFIAYMKTVLDVSSSKAIIGYNQAGIYYSAIQEVTQKIFHRTVRDWLIFNNYLF